MRLPFWLRLPFLHLIGVATGASQPLPPLGYARTPGPRRARVQAERRSKPARRLEVEVLEAGEEVVVWLRGEAGVAEAGVLETALMRLLTRRPACVIFDLSELRFLSSLAMDVLVDYRHATVLAGIHVYRAPELYPAVRETLHRVGLMDLFETVGGAEPDDGSASADSKNLLGRCYSQDGGRNRK